MKYSWISTHLISIMPLVFATVISASLISSFSWVVVVLGIGVLIFIHELGHFLVAKYEKMRVEKFALGFGPTLFHYQYGETDYCLHLLPLGGYVKLAGETPEEGVPIAPDEFMAKTPGSRARVIVAGVVMNFILGFILVVVAFFIGIRFPAGVIGKVQAGSPAWHAGLQRGDEIVAMDGKPIHEFHKIGMAIAFATPNKHITVQFKRNGELLECQVLPKYNESLGIFQIGIAPFFSALHVEEDSPLYQAGLRSNDRPIKLDEHVIEEGSDLYNIITNLKGKSSVTLTIDRNGQQMTFPLQLKTQEEYRLGVIARRLEVADVRQNSLAEKLGFKAGEIITAVNQNSQVSSKKLTEMMQENPICTLTLKNIKTLETRQIELTWDKLNTTATQLLNDLAFFTEIYLDEVVPETPASKYLQAGDKFIEINDTKIESWSDLPKFVRNSEGKALKIKIERNDEQKVFEIQPVLQTELTGEEFTILTKLSETQSMNIIDSCKYGVLDAYQMICDVFNTLKGVVQRNISTQNLGGPIMIFSASHSQLQRGFGYFLYFLGLISINLAVINLFPIPALDGGHLLFLGIEKLRGKPVSIKVMAICNMIGIGLLLLLVVYVTYNDISRFFQ